MFAVGSGTRYVGLNTVYSVAEPIWAFAPGGAVARRCSQRWERTPTMCAHSTTAREELRHLLLGYRVSQAIAVATELGASEEP